MSARPMKDTGIEWIGVIPRDWAVTRLKYLADFVNGDVFRPDEWADDGVPIIRIENLNGGSNFNRTCRVAAPRHHVAQGDLLFGWSGNRGTSFGPFRWSHLGHFYLNQHIFKIVNIRAQRDWFYWALVAATLDIEGRAHGTIGMVHVTRGELGHTSLPVPRASEQHRIAAFLDTRTATIDAAITEHGHTLALLSQRRRTLVSHVVTRGLDPDAPMRDSGVPWIGEIPARWSAVRLVRVARLESGHTPSRQVADYWKPAECTIPWFTLADVWQLREGRQEYLGDTAEKVSPAGVANSSARVLPAGTVILSRTASVGFSGIMPRPMATTQDFANWVCGPSLLPEYLLFVLRSMSREFERMKQGSTHQTIYMPDLKKLTIPLPPLDEQRAIVAHLRARTSVIDEAAETARRAIALLREYRQSLVTAAVTGRIDVEASS